MSDRSARPPRNLASALKTFANKPTSTDPVNRRIRRAFPFALLFFLIGCTAEIQTGSEKEIIMPAWFWDSPASTAVGYSLPHQDSEDAYADAFHDAAWRLFCDRRCRIAGEKAVASSPEGTMQMGSTIGIDVDSTGFEAFSRSLVRLDSAATRAMRIILVGGSNVTIDRTPVPAPVTAPDNGSTPVGYGSAPPYYYESSSWIEAEYKARLELALQAYSRFTGSSERIDDQILKTSVTGTDVILTNVQTVCRRMDRKNGTVKVWVTGRAETK